MICIECNLCKYDTFTVPMYNYILSVDNMISSFQQMHTYLENYIIKREICLSQAKRYLGKYYLKTLIAFV